MSTEREKAAKSCPTHFGRKFEPPKYPQGPAPKINAGPEFVNTFSCKCLECRQYIGKGKPIGVINPFIVETRYSYLGFLNARRLAVARREAERVQAQRREAENRLKLITELEQKELSKKKEESKNCDSKSNGEAQNNRGNKRNRERRSTRNAATNHNQRTEPTDKRPRQ